MNDNNIYNKLKEKFYKILKENNLLSESININTKTLTTQEAIGDPDRKDFPLLKGKEKLIQAEFKGYYGQAFTDMPGNYNGSLIDIVEMPLESNYQRAIFISALNAVLSYLGLIDRTIHCKGNDTEKCAKELVEYIKEKYINPKITLIGFQPAFLENLAKSFNVRVLDLDKDRIGTKKYNVLIEDGEKDLDNVMNWCSLIVATGSTVVNSTMVNYICKKPAIFYGTTVAATAYLLGLQRFCTYSK